mmetsp:Transcript_20006/g.29657  ORF Transcript_20006/g.29657 Transcript_20006/m.29657 type:complete len:425 (-) Transcript_20006:239-1513(-)|eukprot:CAMPEP_0194213780 /NCGR_PEP_ID=MMETSP0156-20130528/14588_1 /TAXON_ID=33649 /ORGANISM="Thalassionema nitzschioides, Strain L26-B" /LENGTH=424 /DNA_ID=CAMNT_0038941891 /DNA_START=107 /DNA_END=1381 /DNA_ORIENTATION=+
MGNKPISVGIRTNQSSYKAGDTVYGRVYLSVSKESEAAEGLLLRLVGEEEATVHHQTSHEEPRQNSRGSTRCTEDHYERSNSCFFHVEYPLHTCKNGKLTRGQYEYPFSIDLPQNLTSSMSVRVGESCCEINYKVIVVVKKAQEGASSLFRSNIQANQRVDISSMDSSFDDTSIQLPFEVFPITNCCCFERGTMVLEASMDKTIVAPLSTVEVAYRAINNSTSVVDRVCVKISQITTWCSNGHSKTLETILDERNIDGEDYPALRRLAKKPKIYIGKAVAETLILNQEWSSTRLHLPSKSLDSYQGRLLEVKHVLSVQLISKGCCTSNPDSSTRIYIVRFLQNGEVKDASANSLDVAPSAPLDTFDTTSPSFDDQKQPLVSLPLAEAHVLPPDWNAQLAEVVDIPMAHAVIVKPASPVNGKELT